MKQGILNDAEYDNRMGVLCDPQTSGGLLVAIPPEYAETFVEAFEQRAGRKPTRIGEVVDAPAGLIFMR